MHLFHAELSPLAVRDCGKVKAGLWGQPKIPFPVFPLPSTWATITVAP